MIADADLQVWLDTRPSTSQVVIVPYVQSMKGRQMEYKLDLVQTGKYGNSKISQRGQVVAAPANPTAMTSVSVTTAQGGTCTIEVELAENGAPIGRYQFDCMKQK